MKLWNLTNLLFSADETDAVVDTLLNATTEETAAAAGGLSEIIENFDPMRFVDNLTYMGVGMLGIFIVMGTLIIGTAILNKVTNLKKK